MLNTAKKVIFSVLFLSFLAPILMSSDCDTEPPPQICFELDLGVCPLAGNATLKLERIEMDYISLPGGGLADFPYIAETKQDYTSPRNEKYVTGWRHGCYSSGDNVSCSWRELYKHHYGVYPNPTQLANMTQQQATDWFRDKYKNPCWPMGPQYASVSNAQENRNVGGPICFNYPDPLISTMPNFKREIMPFQGKIIFPNGKECDIEPMTWPSKPQNGQKVTVKVKPKVPCSACM